MAARYWVVPRANKSKYHTRPHCSDASSMIVTHSISGLTKCKRCEKADGHESTSSARRDKVTQHSNEKRTEVLFNIILAEYPVSVAAQLSKVPTSTAYRWFSEYQEKDKMHSEKKLGRPPAIPYEYEPLVLALFYDRSMTIERAIQEYYEYTGIKVSNTAITYILNKNRYSYHIHKVANPISFSESHKILRKKWAHNYLEKYRTKTPIFIDECRFENTPNRKSWRKKGQIGNVPDLTWTSTKISVCAAMSRNGVLVAAPTVGHFNGEKFAFVIEQLKKKVDLKDCVLIMDNVSYHKSKKVKELLANVQFEMLPSYTPQFNAIEFLWHNIKTKIR